jgi:hypothetical protein
VIAREYAVGELCRRCLRCISANRLIVAAALEKPTLQSLRSFQHKDTQGNEISMSHLSHHHVTPAANTPQLTLISPTPHARDGSAHSTPSSRSKPPSMANTGAARRRIAPTRQN